MEQQIVRLPLLLFFLTAVAGGLASAYFPFVGWVVLPVLIAAFAAAVFSAFYTTRYTTYHGTVDTLLKLFFCLFSAVMMRGAFEPWLTQRETLGVIAAYFLLLVVVYVVRSSAERRAHWDQFDATLVSPTLAVEKNRVRRIVKAGRGDSRGGNQRSSSRWVANLGAALGVAVASVVGATFGADGKQLLLVAITAALLVSPFLLLRFVVPYSVGIRVVRAVERHRNQCFDFDNASALQEARSRVLIARLLNPRLRQESGS